MLLPVCKNSCNELHTLQQSVPGSLLEPLIQDLPEAIPQTAYLITAVTSMRKESNSTFATPAQEVKLPGSPGLTLSPSQAVTEARTQEQPNRPGETVPSLESLCPSPGPPSSNLSFSSVHQKFTDFFPPIVHRLSLPSAPVPISQDSCLDPVTE